MAEHFTLCTVLIISVVTIIVRLLPFIVFSGKNTPEFILYLGKVLPFAIMGMLVVYCLKEVSLIKMPHGLPEALAIVLVSLLHIKFKNTLISITLGTVFYMFLVQVVF